MEKRVSEAVIRRMPRYYRHLCELHDNGVTRISSGMLAERMGLTASQVRQDFNCFGGFGQQGYGYHVEQLRDSIARILNIDLQRKAVIVGAGNLGKALMTNFNFNKVGVRLIGAFDTNPMLIGTEIAGVSVLSCRDLERFMEENAPEIAILTLPLHHAKAAAQRLIACGIQGLWNFTGSDLQMAVGDVPVENVHFSDSLMVLSYRIKE